MAKLGKFNSKLKSAIKRWPSFTKLSRPLHSPIMADIHDESDDNNEDHKKVISKKEVHEVYVGKSRRRYLLGSHVVRHPLFQELIERSLSGGCRGGGDGGSDGDYDHHHHHHEQVVVVACEVVLFEHLLWMLESDAGGSGGCSDASQSHAMRELADFYFTAS